MIFPSFVAIAGRKFVRWIGLGMNSTPASRPAPFPGFLVALACTFAVSPMLAQSPSLEQRAQAAAVSLPAGCIVTARQVGDAAPQFSVAGRSEPPGVKPENMVFEIGSISKVFTAILLAQAVIEKKVRLDSTAGEMMGPRQAFADRHVAAITLEQLATHTSGLPRLPDDLISKADPLDPYADYDRRDLDASLRTLTLTHAPPFPTEYSNFGVGLLGDLLSRLHGKEWEELAVNRIARLLGMRDTCVRLSAEQQKRFAPAYKGAERVKPWRFDALAGAGALRSTAADLLRFCRAIEHPESTPMKEAIEMVKRPRGGDRFGLCLLVSLEAGKTLYWYQGGTGGFGSWISIDPMTREKTVVLINNSELAPERVLFGDETTDMSAQPADATLADYAGVYDTGVKARGTEIHYVFEVRGGDLWMEITGQPFVKLSRHATAKDRFEFKPVNAEIQFARMKGSVISTTLFQSGLEILAKKIAGPKK